MRFSCHRVGPLKGCALEKQALSCVNIASEVYRIADYGMSQCAGVSPDLVCSARQNGPLYQGRMVVQCPSSTAQGLETRMGMFLTDGEKAMS